MPWVTRDGRRLEYSAMSDQHLWNALRMLWRIADAAAFSDAGACYGFSPDSMAAYYAEQEAADLDPESLVLRYEAHRARPLLKEWRRRFGSAAWERGEKLPERTDTRG